MKKIFYTAIGIIALAACSKVEPIVTPDSAQVFSLEASLPEMGSDTKTSIALDGERYSIYWESGDRISAGDNNISNPLEGVTKSSSSVFTFSKAVTNGAFVRCPGVADSKTLVLPSEHTSVGGLYDPQANPLWGVVTISDDTVPSAKLALNNTMAMLLFQIKGASTITKASLETIAGEPLCGTFKIGNDGVVSNGVDTDFRISVNFASPIELNAETATELFIPILPAFYSKGMALQLYDDTGKMMRLTFFKTGQSLTNLNLAKFSVNYAGGREEVILPLNNLDADDAIYDDYNRPDKAIKVGTFNVWADFDRENKVEGDAELVYRGWNYAKEYVAAEIDALDCDVIGFNELALNTHVATGSSSLLAAIKSHTTKYTFSFDWPNFVYAYSNKVVRDYTFANGFAYDASVVRLEASGMFWLNEDGFTPPTSNTGSDLHWDDLAGGKRTCVWAKFTQLETGKVFYFASTHLAIESQGAVDGVDYPDGVWNLLTAQCLIKHFKARTGASDSSPIIIAGDMNSSHESAPNAGFRYIVNKPKSTDEFTNTTLPFDDVRDMCVANGTLPHTEKGIPGTSLGEHNLASRITQEKYRYDHIMVRNVSNVACYTSIRTSYTAPGDPNQTAWQPSDHSPISAYVVL